MQNIEDLVDGPDHRFRSVQRTRSNKELGRQLDRAKQRKTVTDKIGNDRDRIREDVEPDGDRLNHVDKIFENGTNQIIDRIARVQVDPREFDHRLVAKAISASLGARVDKIPIQTKVCHDRWHGCVAFDGSPEIEIDSGVSVEGGDDSVADSEGTEFC